MKKKLLVQIIKDIYLLLQEIPSLLPLSKRIVLLFLFLCVSTTFLSCYFSNYYDSLSDSLTLDIRKIESNKESNTYLMQTRSYKIIEMLQEKINDRNFWHHEVMRILGDEPLLVSKADDSRDGFHVEVVGDYLEVLMWMDKIMNEMPYIRTIPEEITYTAAGTKWRFLIST